MSSKVSYQTGNMWDSFDEPNSLFLITTNSFIKKDGDLVMGRGIAAEAKKRYPKLPAAFGAHITHGGKYGLLVGPNCKMGAFQVKYHFRDKAQLKLIAYSCEKLMDWLDANPGYSANLPLPGCGNGKLDPKLVWPILEELLDKRVTIWTFK